MLLLPSPKAQNITIFSSYKIVDGNGFGCNSEEISQYNFSTLRVSCSYAKIHLARGLFFTQLISDSRLPYAERNFTTCSAQSHIRLQRGSK